jgi:HSP20 family protein
MASFRWNSLHGLVAIQERMNRLFEETIYRNEFTEDAVPSSLWTPAADAYESAAEIVFHTEIPGVSLEDVKLETDGGVLRLSGARVAAVKGRFLRMERVYGEFFREFPIPRDVDADRIAATLECGVLTIRVPKAGMRR